MSRPRLLTDAAGLIAVARLGLLEQVSTRIAEIAITESVLAEVDVEGRPAAGLIRGAIRDGMVDVIPGPATAIAGLGSGESSTIEGASQAGLVAVLDDRDARRTATRLGVTMTGTVALLVRLAQLGAAGPIEELLDALDRIGFRVAADVRAWAVEAANADR